MVPVEVVERIKMAADIVNEMPDDPLSLLDNLPTMAKLAVKQFTAGMDLEELIDPLLSVKRHLQTCSELIDGQDS